MNISYEASLSELCLELPHCRIANIDVQNSFTAELMSHSILAFVLWMWDVRKPGPGQFANWV